MALETATSTAESTTRVENDGVSRLDEAVIEVIAISEDDDAIGLLDFVGRQVGLGEMFFGLFHGTSEEPSSGKWHNLS